MCINFLEKHRTTEWKWREVGCYLTEDTITGRPVIPRDLLLLVWHETFFQVTLVLWNTRRQSLALLTPSSFFIPSTWNAKPPVPLCAWVESSDQLWPKSCEWNDRCYKLEHFLVGLTSMLPSFLKDKASCRLGSWVRMTKREHVPWKGHVTWLRNSLCCF